MPDLRALKPHLVINLCCHSTITIPCNAFESGHWKALDVSAPSVVEVSRIGCFVLVALTLIPHTPWPFGNPLFAALQHSCHCLPTTTGTRTLVAQVKAEYPNQLDYSGSGQEVSAQRLMQFRLWGRIPENCYSMGENREFSGSLAPPWCAGASVV